MVAQDNEGVSRFQLVVGLGDESESFPAGLSYRYDLGIITVREIKIAQLLPGPLLD